MDLVVDLVVSRQQQQQQHDVLTLRLSPLSPLSLSDGFVNVWDGLQKKRLCQFSRLPTSVSALDFSPDGSLLAVAASYLWEEGEKEADAVAAPSITIRRVRPSDVTPKPRKSRK